MEDTRIGDPDPLSTPAASSGSPSDNAYAAASASAHLLAPTPLANATQATRRDSSATPFLCLIRWTDQEEERVTEDTRTDDGNRGATGLAISVVERPDGKVWLVFDDVRRAGWKAPFQWNTEWFFTRFEVELADLLEHRLDDQVLANIGLAVVARLAARQASPTTR